MSSTLTNARIIAGQVSAKALCMPDKVTTTLDTVKMWLYIAAGAAAVAGLLMIGIGLMIDRQHGEGSRVLKHLGFWIGGALLVAAASVIAAAFIPTDAADCVKHL